MSGKRGPSRTVGWVTVGCERGQKSKGGFQILALGILTKMSPLESAFQGIVKAHEPNLHVTFSLSTGPEAGLSPLPLSPQIHPLPLETVPCYVIHTDGEVGLTFIFSCQAARFRSQVE